MQAKLLRKMTIDGITYNGGEIIEVGAWRNLKTLQSNRYIAIISEELKPKASVKQEIKSEVENGSHT